MENIKEKNGTEDEFKQALANLQHLQLKFYLKINALKALKHSIKDALFHSEASQKDCNIIQTELENLTTLRQEYETMLESFNASFATKHFEETTEAWKAAAKNLSASFDIQTNLEMLMRKIKRQLERQEDDDTDEKEVKEEVDYENKQEEGEKNRQNDNKSCSSDEEKESKEPLERNPKEKTIMSMKLKIALSIMVVVAFYSGLGLIIQVFNENNKNSQGVTTRPAFKQDNKTCGADSFMLRDGVCDETANTAKCLYDGGDCCEENKDKVLCRDCKCILSVDHDDVRAQFQESQVKPVQDLDGLFHAIRDSNDGWTVEVEHVVSMQVCTVLCFEHEKADELNAWHYIANQKICRCGQVHSSNCAEKLTKKKWTWEANSNYFSNDTIIEDNAFIQLKKTVSCNCLADGFLITGEASRDAQVEYGDSNPKVTSLWHCRELCKLYLDCEWISWNIDGGDCRMLQVLPETTAVSSHHTIDPNWVSSSKDCVTIGGHFESQQKQKQKHKTKWQLFPSIFAGYFTIGGYYNFICPHDKTFPVVGQSTINAEPSGDTSSFVIYVVENTVVVLKVEEGSNVVECAHSILPPFDTNSKLTLATGGILTTEDSDEPLAVLCGGELMDNDSKSNMPNKMCTILTENHLKSKDISISGYGSLNIERVGAASVVKDNGSTLWVIGGFFESMDQAVRDSEFVSLSRKNSSKSNIFPRNAAGPRTEQMIAHHCLEMVDAEVAILVGGMYISNGQASPSEETWSIDLRTPTEWDRQANLRYARTKHACGVLRVGHLTMALVVAGGIDYEDNYLSTVEILQVEKHAHLFQGEWLLGPRLPTELSDAAAITTPDQQALYIIGGTSKIATSRSVFILSCQSLDDILQDCSWTKADFELKSSSAKGLALSLPRISMAIPMKDPNLIECSEENIIANGTILLVTTGLNEYYALGDTERFFVGSSVTSEYGSQLIDCQPLPHPVQSMHALESATGGVLSKETDNETQHIPIVCGGRTPNTEYNDKCFHTEGGEAVGIMRELRHDAASISILNGTILWITGGQSYVNVLDTTEWINVTTVLSSLNYHSKPLLPTLAQGISLPARLTRHCLAMINSDTVIVSGVSSWISSSIYHPPLGDVWTIGNLTKLFSESTTTKTSYWRKSLASTDPRERHGCGVIKVYNGMKYIVAGGEDNNGEPIDSVEILKVKEDKTDGQIVDIKNSWSYGPKMPTPLSRAASAIKDDQSVIFLAGGLNGDLSLSGSVFSFRCKSAGYCWWNTESVEVPRQSPVALIIPPRTGIFSPEENLDPNGSKPCPVPSSTYYDNVGDNNCDGAYNNKDCDFDGGDCCQPESLSNICYYCSGTECICSDTGLIHCKIYEEDCPEFNSYNIYDDGECDESMNIVSCGFDGGDCCIKEALCNWCSGDGCICHETGRAHCS